MMAFIKMTSFFLILVIAALVYSKPKWKWVEKPDEHLDAMKHMDQERFGEYKQMDDQSFMDAFEADLNMAPITKKKREESGLDLNLKCEKGWTFFGGQCYKKRPKDSGGPETFPQAINYCTINYDSHILLMTGYPGEDAFIKGMFPYTESPWIGLSQPAEEGLWEWIDGAHLKATEARWKEGAPSKDKLADCAVVTKDGWVDVNCEEPHLVVCQKNPIGDTQHPFKYCPDGWEYSQTAENELIGACYWVANKEATWAEANADCKSKHADIVSVTTDEEFDMTLRMTRWPYMWIGLTDQPGIANALEGWVWSDGRLPLLNGFEAVHYERLKNKIKEPKEMTGPVKQPKVESTFSTSNWCKLEKNHDYCDKRNMRWKIGNRWDDWEMYCKRTPECKNRKLETVSAEKHCAAIDTKKKMWKKMSCDAKKGINYACKTEAYLELRPMDPNRDIPNHFTQFSDAIGDCTTTDKKLILAHTTCLRNWYELTLGGSTVAKLATQCPNFCDPRTNATGDGSCVWDIACVRCEQLVSLCSQGFATPTCERYIKKNAKKSDHNRCPQFDLCYPQKGVMKEIQKTCLEVYAHWDNEFEELKYDIEHITYPCDQICAKLDLDCAWKILCKKCTLLMSLSHTGRKQTFKDQLEVIMKKKNVQRCSQYTGDIMPPWWVTGNWI